MTIKNPHAMTGWQLWHALTGNNFYHDRESHTFEAGDRTWRAWMTRGRGKNQGAYCHLSAKVQLRVTHNGEDTGHRIEDVAHYRGKANETIGQYQEVR